MGHRETLARFFILFFAFVLQVEPHLTLDLIPTTSLISVFLSFSARDVWGGRTRVPLLFRASLGRIQPNALMKTCPFLTETQKVLK